MTDVPRLTPERRAEITGVGNWLPWNLNPRTVRLVAAAIEDLLRELTTVEAERDELRLLYQSCQEALTEAMDELGKLCEYHDALEQIARHPGGDYEPGEGSDRRAEWEHIQLARKVIEWKADEE